MEFVSLSEILKPAMEKRYAVGAFNIWNAETVQAIVEAAEEEASPVIFITGPMEIPLLKMEPFLQVIKASVKKANIPISLHLDHYTDPDFVLQCIHAGFPSVMIDASKLSFEENIRVTSRVVQEAHKKGVSVEGELGRVGKVGLTMEDGDKETISTDPSKCVEFVERTKVDALAINIGNAHGMYKEAPRLDFELLKKVADLVRVPLVLHGGSSTPVADLKKAVSLGIRKVNVATEMHVAFSDVVYKELKAGNGFIWVSDSLMRVKEAQKAVVRRWIQNLGSSKMAK